MSTLQIDYKTPYNKYIIDNYYIINELDSFLYECKDKIWKKWIKYVYDSLFFHAFQREYYNETISIYKDLDVIYKFIEKFNSVKANKISKLEWKALTTELETHRDNRKICEDKLKELTENINKIKVKIEDNDLEYMMNLFHSKLPKMNETNQQKCYDKLESYTTQNEKIYNFCIVYGNLLYSHNEMKVNNITIELLF